jgi:Spy/CpxP family protein refolding chaperone
MKLCVSFATLACLCCLFVAAPNSAAQSAQSLSPQAIQNIQNIVRTLNLTPEQVSALIPILRAEAPKIQAIKSDPSLSRMQKLEQMRAIHAETDPQVRSILSPEQYQQLQQIRAQEIQQMIRRRMGQ